MATKMTVNGVSTTTCKDQFQIEKFYSSALKGYRYAWDYRDKEGILHSGCAKTAKAAVEKAREYGYQQ